MTDYRRYHLTGGAYFFTVNLAERNSRLLIDRIDLLRRVLREVGQVHPFTLDAVVVLPDHLPAVWTLLEGDSDFSLRRRQIKSAFSRGIEPGERISQSRTRKHERGFTTSPPANQAMTLPNIHQNSLVMEEIRDALNAGKEVITHTDAVSVPGWSGAGYILFDPQTGDGAFKIGGGANGGCFLAGVFHGAAIGYTLFYMSVASSDPKALPYAVASLGILLEEILIVVATWEYYGLVYGVDEQACYLAGIGIGMLAAGATTDVIEWLGKLNTSSLPVKLLSRALSLAMAHQNIAPANCGR
jgi:REP element-mobilizing transposase RayT